MSHDSCAKAAHVLRWLAPHHGLVILCLLIIYLLHGHVLLLRLSLIISDVGRITLHRVSVPIAGKTVLTAMRVSEAPVRIRSPTAITLAPFVAAHVAGQEHVLLRQAAVVVSNSGDDEFRLKEKGSAQPGA